MPRHARRLAETGVYHVMLRGVNRDAIFLDHNDREVLLAILGRVKVMSSCVVLAYCLMSNHVHLVLRTDGEAIGPTMKRLGVRYAGWFNRKYQRVGHLFQDRFLSNPVEDDAYFIGLIRYVWNNPVQANLVDEPCHYRWNSCAPGQPVGLVDESSLDDLLPSLARADLAAAPPAEPVRKAEPGRRRAHSAAEVVRLLEVTCGARTPAEFAELNLAEQRVAIGALRTRSVAYEAIAEATGLSRARVQRLHAMGKV